MRVGDVVRVKCDSRVAKAGEIGEIVAVTEFEFPYEVLLDSRLETLCFDGDELEKVEDQQQVLSHDFVSWMCAEFDRMKELFKQKNQQYGATDPLANFRTAAKMNDGSDALACMFNQAWCFASKHVAHVANTGIHGSKVDESLGDIAVYAMIMKYMYEKEKKHECN